MGTYLSHPVTKNLTLHRMSKMEFQPDFRNPQMLSFLNMYNTMRSKMNGSAVREHFFSKNAEKQRFWGSRFWINWLRRGLAPTIFEIETFFTCVLENLGQKLSGEPWADILGSKLSEWQPVDFFPGADDSEKCGVFWVEALLLLKVSRGRKKWVRPRK